MAFVRLFKSASKRGFCGCETILGLIFIVFVFSIISKSCSDEEETNVPPRKPQSRQESRTETQSIPAFVDFPTEQASRINVLGVSANMTLDDGVGDSLYSPRNILNNDRRSAWAAKFNRNDFPCVAFKLPNKAVKYVSIVNGNQKKRTMLNSNARAKTVEFTFYNSEGNVVLNTSYGLPSPSFNAQAVVETAVIFDRAPNNIDEVSLCVTDIYEGERWENDLFITRVSFFGK